MMALSVNRVRILTAYFALLVRGFLDLCPPPVCLAYKGVKITEKHLLKHILKMAEKHISQLQKLRIWFTELHAFH